jgi:hypothetical protein
MVEETGCILHDAAHFGQVVHTAPQGWVNRIELVTGRISGTPRADRREIDEVGLFAPDALPPTTYKGVHEYLALWAASER